MNGFGGGRSLSACYTVLGIAVVVVLGIVSPTANGFTLTVNVHGATQFSMKRESTKLRTLPEESHELHVPYPYSYGERALQGAGMAKKVRNLRTTRGRSELNTDNVATAPISEQDHKPTVTASLLITTNEKKRPLRKPSSDADAVPGSLSLPYASALNVLRAYHLRHSDLVLPRRFIVPHDTHYPKEWHGVDLPGTVYTMRWWQLHVRRHPDRVAELNSLGFVWDRLQPEWNLILEALITYSALYGDVLVPVSFVVPHDDLDYPEATWGISLGKCVHRMRLRHDFLKGPKGAARRSQLNQLSFVWDVKEYVFEKFCAALVHYGKMQAQQRQQQQGDWDVFEQSLQVPSSFCVPCDASWPRGLWGYPLGAKCAAVRQKGLYVKGDVDRQARLETIGFSWKGNACRSWYQVIHAAALYSQIMHTSSLSSSASLRVLDVPSDYRVPSPPEIRSAGFYVGSDEAWPWPETLWGFPLGQRLKDIRLKGAYLKGEDGPKRRAQLDALGFVWNPPRGRRKSE